MWLPPTWTSAWLLSWRSAAEQQGLPHTGREPEVPGAWAPIPSVHSCVTSGTGPPSRASFLTPQMRTTCCGNEARRAPAQHTVGSQRVPFILSRVPGHPSSQDSSPASVSKTWSQLGRKITGVRVCPGGPPAGRLNTSVPHPCPQFSSPGWALSVQLRANLFYSQNVPSLPVPPGPPTRARASPESGLHQGCSRRRTLLTN